MGNGEVDRHIKLTCRKQDGGDDDDNVGKLATASQCDAIHTFTPHQQHRRQQQQHQQQHIHLVSEGNRRSLRSSFDNMCAVPRTTRTTASETEALELPVREFGIICLVACEHLTSVTNILKRY